MMKNGTYMNELGGAFIEADRLECAMFFRLNVIDRISIRLD